MFRGKKKEGNETVTNCNAFLDKYEKKMRSKKSSTHAQQKMVKESLTKAIEELHTGKSKHNARSLFLAC